MHHTPSILIFDSGLGGLTVFREVMAVRPDGRYLYVADDVFFPYARHSEEVLIGRIVPLIGDLIAAHAPELVVIACNTASTLALPYLRSRFATPFVGTVPAIKPACSASKSKLVSVLGTEATVQREYTRALIRDFAQECTVTLVGSARLAALAETALCGDAVNDVDIVREITPCFVNHDGRRTDTVVLACTHYPLLLDRLLKLAPWPVNWIDPAPAIARQVINLIGLPPSSGAVQGTTQVIFTSGALPGPTLPEWLVCAVKK